MLLSTLCLLALGGFRMALIAFPNAFISVHPLCILAAMPVVVSNSSVECFQMCIVADIGDLAVLGKQFS